VRNASSFLRLLAWALLWRARWDPAFFAFWIAAVSVVTLLLLCTALRGWLRSRTIVIAVASSTMPALAVLCFLPTVRLEELLSHHPAVEHRLLRRFGDEIYLLGFELRVADGASIELELYWTAAKRPRGRWVVFTHLIAANEGVVSQHDGVPGEGKRPTDWWLPWEVIEDRHVIPLQGKALSAGEYRLEIGLYSPESGERLPAFAGGEPLPAQRVVLPALCRVSGAGFFACLLVQPG